MASIIKRNKTYSVIYYEGEGSKRQQKWESGLTYSAARTRKATIEYELEHNIHVPVTDLTVGEFLYEFIENTAKRSGSHRPTAAMWPCSKTMCCRIGAKRS